MAISKTLKNFLEGRKVPYKLVSHTHTQSSADLACPEHIPLQQMAKAVVLEDEQGYIVGVLPSNHRIEVDWVNEKLGRKLRLASENDLSMLFSDCDIGAVPALSNAYGLKLIWDEKLRHASDVYFEAGDHEHLVQIKGGDFTSLVSSNPACTISAQPDYSRWV